MSSQLVAKLPLELNRPGAYHLETDLHGPAGEYSVLVTSDDVTLDLRGHNLYSEADTAILLSASGFTLRNGRLQAAGPALAPLPHVRADHCHLEDLQVKGGLFVGGCDLNCSRVEVEGGSFGIKGGERARLEHCSVEGCLLGIEVAAGSRVERCTVKDCEEGVYAFGSRECASHLERVVVYECAGLGLRLDGPGVVHLCEAHNNGREEASGGILAGPASVVSECEAYGNRGGDIVIVEPCELAENRTSDGSGR